MDEIEIPCYFLCPISMQLMKDPVTVATGITYDRESIEKWLFTCNNTAAATCPVTKQELRRTSDDLIPNHTLRRLIQAWCTLNSRERIPTPKPAADRSHILKLLNDAKNSPESSQLIFLHRLRSIAARNESSRTHLQAAGASTFLSSVVSANADAASRDEALSILQQIHLSESELKKLNKTGFLDSLTHVLQTGTDQSRAHAITLLKSACDVSDPEHLIGSKAEVFTETARLLNDKISPQATKSALKLLIELCPWGRNRIKAVEAGVVAALVELLLDQAAATTERRGCELVMTVLEQLCSCAEGRAELLRHGAGLAVVSKKILRVSGVASDRGVRILSWVSRHSGSWKVVQEMLDVGVVAKLCLVMQMERSEKIKERVKEMLRVHSKVWRDSSCIPPHLLSSYPSS